MGYWAMRTDQSRRSFIWAELQAGRLRQGWGLEPEDDLEILQRLRRSGATFSAWQREIWRGNRRLLPTEPGAMQAGDLVVLPHLPRRGLWSIARVTGGYRYRVSPVPNAWDGRHDYGHIRAVELLTDERAIDPERDNVSEALRRAMRNRQRMWSVDGHGNEIEMLASTRGTRA
jgi:predicted Mrr-cat superfamily restriction endonuclease